MRLPDTLATAGLAVTAGTPVLAAGAVEATALEVPRRGVAAATGTTTAGRGVSGAAAGGSATETTEDLPKTTTEEGEGETEETLLVLVGSVAVALGGLVLALVELAVLHPAAGADNNGTVLDDLPEGGDGGGLDRVDSREVGDLVVVTLAWGRRGESDSREYGKSKLGEEHCWLGWLVVGEEKTCWMGISETSRSPYISFQRPHDLVKT